MMWKGAVRLVRAALQPPLMRKTADRRNRGDVLAFVAAHPEPCRLTIAELIAGTELSRSTLYRALQSEGGVDVFLFGVRLKAAYDLIAAGTPLHELPRKCGFCNASHLTRRFKRHFGLTPLDLKRSLSS